jgi:phytoene desaturase
MRRISIIGTGFSSLASACYLAKAGFDVNMYEKNDQIGGRARTYERDGFRFDMGPSWYWMPDIYERFFNDFGKTTSDFYNLLRLSPSYKVYFEDSSYVNIADNMELIYEMFEKEEPGSSKHLKKFISRSETNYRASIDKVVYRPGFSPLELITPETVANVNQFFTTISHEVRKRFKSKKLIQLLEFPVLFLGAKAEDTPAFYSFMNYADFVLGTWYPEGGMHKIVEALSNQAVELGVKIHTSSPVEKILTKDKKAVGLLIDGQEVYADLILSGADYVHTESLLEPRFRRYSPKYWDKKVFAPSALVFYVGFNKKLENISHHVLFFDKDIKPHAEDIYDNKQWPEAPLFYANFTSMTDDSVAPKGKETGFFLIPIAPDLEDSEEVREKYFEQIISRLELHTKQSVKSDIIFHDSYCVSDFKKDYNSYKGNAYGMANTLRQTAFLKPKIRSNKVANLYFTGQLTVPGPGVPPSLISGKIVADQIIKDTSKSKKYEESV